MQTFQRLALLALVVAATPLSTFAQQTSEFQLVNQSLDNPDNEPAPVFPVPSARQLKWNQTEFYAFFHYGMNTFTGSEWGSGSEAETTYAPKAKPNPKQWLEAAKAAGMRGGIAVVKHHDGFCLWPTETTTHCITNSGTEYGRTNIAKEFADAARELDMKYGFYVSPWDLNNEYWGLNNSDYVNKVFFRQCAELAQYGTDQFEMWFDGASGSDHSGYYGGANTYRTLPTSAAIYYDIPNLRDSIHKVCPNIVLWGVGEEARWIGNEAGWAGETCWSMGNGTSGNETQWKWFPGESDAKISNSGWFWHANETLKTAERLFQMYLETVGRNATLILNCAPDTLGAIPPATVTRMKELGNLLKKRLGTDLTQVEGTTIEASVTRASGVSRTYDAANMIDRDSTTYWAAPDGNTSATITITFPSVQTVRYVSLMEYITLGQRVKGFNIEVSEDGTTFTKMATGITQSTIGYKRIIPLNGSTSSSYGSGYKAKVVRINITDSKACPTLHTVSVF